MDPTATPVVEFGLGIITKLSSVASNVISGIGSYVGLGTAEPGEDEALALRLQGEEKQMEESRHREEESLSLQAIQELERSGEITPQHSAYPGFRRLSQSEWQRYEEERLSRELIEQLARDGEIMTTESSRRVSGRSVRIVPGARTETHLRRQIDLRRRPRDLSEVMASAVGLLSILEQRTGNEDTKQRLRELVVSLQHMQSLGNDHYEVLLSSMQDVKTPAKNKENMPVYIWKEKLEEEKAPDEDVICNICLSTYETGDQIKLLPCLHKYHKNCIDPWLDSHNKCPVCKFSVDNIQ